MKVAHSSGTSTEAAASKKRYTPGSAGARCRAAKMVSAGRRRRTQGAVKADNIGVEARGWGGYKTVMTHMVWKADM